MEQTQHEGVIARSPPSGGDDEAIPCSENEIATPPFGGSQ